MGNDNTNSNIIHLRDTKEYVSEQLAKECDVEDISEFMVDMLDTLMQIAARKDHSLLVYFLAMARIEAVEMIDKRDQ